MDSATGSFLRATLHRKLVFSIKPNGSCLFYFEQGKSHHWGLRSVMTQRYIGQNLVQNLVVASKKLHAWEAFRVLQRPQDHGLGACSPQVYFILGASRFGKGMWLANKSGSMSFGHSAKMSTKTRNNNLNQEIESEKSHVESNYPSKRGTSRQRGLFLSKQFDHAIGFVYSSDLSALMAIAASVRSQLDSSLASRTNAKAEAAPHFIGTSQQLKGGMFQTPILARWDLGDVRLPWLETSANPDFKRTPSFLQIPEKEMTELTTTTIRGSSVNGFLEMIVPRAIRTKCKIDQSRLTQSAPVGSSATSSPKARGEKYDSVDLLCDWHAHPHFGLVRALSHCSDSGVLSSSVCSSRGTTKCEAPNRVKAVTIEQYHSCTVDDDLSDGDGENKIQVLHKATLRFKMYALSIPYSNCFSIEVVVDVEDVPVSPDDGIERSSSAGGDTTSTGTFDKKIDGKLAEGYRHNPAMKMRWRAGVMFSRNTMFKAQIEHGALDGVRNACASVLKHLRDENMRLQTTSPFARRRSFIDTDGPSGFMNADTASALAANGSMKSLSCRGKFSMKPDLTFLPQAFTIEIGKGLLSAINGAHLVSDNHSTLPAWLPWRPFSGEQSSSFGLVPRHAVTAATATPFFESVPEEFTQVLEVNMGSKVTASLFFEALLSDSCSFFRSAHADSGTMEVDISTWHAMLSPGKSRERTDGNIRKQVFRMLLNRVPGVDIAQVEDFQYYALIKARTQDQMMSGTGHGETDSNRSVKRGSFIQCVGGSQMSMGRDHKCSLFGLVKDTKVYEITPGSLNSQRLEFGMKVYVPALLEGSQFSIEVLVIVEPGDDNTVGHFLRVFFALPLRHGQSETREHAVINPHVVAGVLCGLKQIWKQVAQTMMEICETIVPPHGHQSLSEMAQGFKDLDMYLLQQSRINPNLPTHDELTSQLIEAIAAAYE
ncbi:unnamed protein product [Peronospora belbahrii]|uniref:Uncharacterized protein n=1 Tax=Peronospora belbahrii TaxID=622444 RepID=A0AAU9LA64_9STRA|nr:unnamed protein product [Peronospora belbahrii]